MKVVRASALGICFGVREALAAARELPPQSGATLHGELVHNPIVVDELLRRGFVLGPGPAAEALPREGTVVVTAHGISDRERERLEGAGRRLVDTTCPLVRFAHRSALSLAAEGRFVVVVGRRGHIEILGLIGDLPRAAVVEGAAEVRSWNEPRIGVLFQTTTPAATARSVVAAIRQRNPGADLAVADTICGPTKERQEALADLLDRVEALVVVGGHGSNNTKELVRSAEAQGVPAIHVASVAELDYAWLSRFDVVGLTAGTSTLDETVDEVEREVEAFSGRLAATG